MKHARGVLVGMVSMLLVAGSVDAVADPQLPDATRSPAPTATTVAEPPPTAAAPSGDPATAEGVVVLHTDTGADARSGELRDAIERLGATVRHTFGDQRTVSLALPAGTTAAATTEQLADLPGVAAVERPVTRSFDALPNDQYLPSQRAYLDAVAAPTAWNRQRGSSSVKIAIIDSGLDVGHPDFKNKIAGTYNAVTGSTSVKDTVGHGTFVAGVAAAATNNRTGIAGAGYNSRILAVKVADDDGDIAVDDEIAGIRWAASHGAKVINLSLSGPDSSSAELKAVQYAQSKGVLVVAAAGNDGDTTKQYPAAYPGVIAVGATDVATGRRASFSTYGSWVTLAAPGVNLLSTTPLRTSDYFKANYDRGDGTSFASPLVAGAAALLAAQNPSLKGPQLRAALVASAHGYANSGLGRGQVDFDRALDHVAPTTKPSAALVIGTGGTVTLTATSTAKRVSFRVDNGPLLPSVPVNGITATRTFSTYGYANSGHTVSAVDCTAYGECNTSATSGRFTISNAAPSLDSPAGGDTVSGEFTAIGSADGGGLRLLVNGKEAGFDATSPYTFTVNGSQYSPNGKRQVTVQSCTASHSLCAGPQSDPAATINFYSLHPAISALTRSAISPNNDRSGDYAVLTYRTESGTSVRIETRNSAGRVLRTDIVSAKSYTWRGLGGDGKPLRDGAYRLAVVTEKSTSTGTLHGLVERTVVVDTRFPRLQAVHGNGTRFFPVRDGYRDSFAPTASLPDGGLLTFAVVSAARRTVRTLRANRAPASRTTLPWNGRTAAGRQVKAGTYRWTFSVADAAGNVTRSPVYRTYVDSRRLRTKTVTVTTSAHAKIIGSAKCATKQTSSYRRGAHLVNRCKGGSDEVSYATYSIKMPKALRYGRMTFAAKGRSARTSQLSASFRRADGGLEVPRSVRVKPGKLKWRTVGRVPVAGHVHHGKINVALLLTTKYAGTNDFDARTVRLRVSVVRLG